MIDVCDKVYLMRFTFQYGWIMKKVNVFCADQSTSIYIPVWLDYEEGKTQRSDEYYEIYIPVWLDYEARLSAFGN